jgi:hypothetical protein
LSTLAILFPVALAAFLGASGASKSVDLDGNAANGAESLCELNVLATFPVQIEDKVTNRTGGDAYTFSWPSAGPGGFTSSITPGTTGGVGSKWVWTTNQSVFAYTGATCSTDACFAQTAGPDSLTGFCSDACLADGTSLTVKKSATLGSYDLIWVGGAGTFTVYRGSTKIAVVAPVNSVGTTTTFTFTDTPPADSADFYVVRGADCTSYKACATNTDCSGPSDGTCVSRGPFGVPGRSLLASDVTVSNASLTSSLITFFSPPKEIFRATSSANAGGFADTVANLSTSPVTVTIAAYPPGCCPPNPSVPHQLRCGDACVDYLNDPQNCGACGNVCGDGTCCSNGSCVSLCGEGQTWCDGECVDLRDDSNSCGTCDAVCGDGTCCNQATCASLCPQGQVWCGNHCVDLNNDSANCGSCSNTCGDGTCCNGGACASVCGPGRVFCNGQCVDFQNDSANCGACGAACGDGSCCDAGTCAAFCPAGRVLCGTECVDLADDSANCGACGHACGDGSCCNAGTCASECPAGRVFCNGQCVDLQDDSANCGACGNSCGASGCCSAGACASLCAAGTTLCGGLCYDTQNDPSNCGTCGNVCASDSVCTAGACVTCPGHGSNRAECSNRCVNLNTDPYNCGACGVSCNLGCPSGFKGVCSNGQSCTCVAGTPAPQPPPNFSPPTASFCPNPNPSYPVGAVCPNPNPSSPIAGGCSNPNPSHPIAGVCPNPDPTSPIPGVCPNPTPSPGPVAGVCPSGGSTPPALAETPLCEFNAATQTIPPGGTATTCNTGGVIFKEVPTTITLCGDGIPGVSGECNSTTTKVTTATFNRFLPDPTKTAGNAYVTPYAVHIVGDSSNDGLLEPGETANLVIDVLNAGSMNITNASATLSAPTVDLTADGIFNPVGITVGAGSAAYGTISGTPVSTNCTTPPVQPASNATAFPITVPSNHPGDTSHPFVLAVTGTVNGGPFLMNVPIAIGIADNCDINANVRDFDGLDGLSTPMAKLAPQGEPVPFPSGPFNAGQTRPLKLRMTCGGTNLTDAMVDAPEIVGLSEATRGALDIHSINLNDSGTNPNDPFFRFNNTLSGGQWAYSMRTADLGTGTFTLTIRIAGRKNYVTGFVLD